jgi:hypothetical protein
MISSIAPVRAMPTVEVQAAPVRLAVKLAPSSFGKSIPRDLLFEPHDKGIRMIALDGVTAVIIEAEGHCSQRLALPTKALAKMLQRHDDAQLLAVAPTPDGGDWSWRVKTFSDSFTAVTEMPRGEPLSKGGVATLMLQTRPQGANAGGSWGVMALRPLAQLIGLEHRGLDRIEIKTLNTVGREGPLVATFSADGFSGTLLTMRLRPKEEPAAEEEA